ncbi:type VII secretion-associated serine protease mycosin [Micromonospora cathayae]|uniref:Type VII secretion-associated serine protease mycosin n=1 Tax=Micromonospora cathayae TaxID=3028804 RepID=A0ABY7ZUX7_9ACTN|nr:type VII secretion-associated serine protease mycosin [Micromonospora sp. HUAS 3]WDZ85724.1 type VII secretion-associated serine protease mycosin [Micromonospora sp. HUAS 3]
MTGVPRGRVAGVRWLAGRTLLAVAATAVPLAVPLAGAAPAVAAHAVAAPAPALAASVPAAAPAPVPAALVAAPVAVDPMFAPARADQVRNDQWQLDALDAETAWRTSTGRGVTVAVVDSGVDGSHPDLAGQVLPGLDLVAPEGTTEPDPVGHGTTVAALIAGRRDDQRGAVGLAPDAKILPVRVLDAENRYDDALIVARGVRWAVDNGARVINLSLGGGGDSPALAAALDYAFARDVVVVACTGNLAVSPGNRVWYPAREPGVIAVSGLERDGDDLWSGSITGPETVLTAPATGLVGARPGGYWRVQGTSFAAPLVTAAAALVRARFPQMSAGEVVNRLISTARDLGPAGRDDRFGFGRVDPVAALTRDVPAVPRNPLDDQSSPGEVGFGRAPGSVEQTTVDADQLGLRTRGDSWTARAAGGAEAATPGRLWAGVVTGAVLVATTALLVRRFRRPARR